MTTMPTVPHNLEPVTTHHGQTPTQAALQTSLFSPELVDIKFWVFSRRVSTDASQLDEPTSFKIVKPLPVYGISLVLLHTPYFRQLLSSGFTESSAETTFYAPYPPENQDFVDDYDYDSDSDLEDESGAGYDDWEVEVPQPKVIRREVVATPRCAPVPITILPAARYEAYEEEMEMSNDVIRETSDSSHSIESLPSVASEVGYVYERETICEEIVYAEGYSVKPAPALSPCIDGLSAQPCMAELSPHPNVESSPHQDDIDDKHNAKPGAPCRQIIIKHAAFLTFRALIYYLYTGKVTFLPLRNRDPAARNVTTRRLLANRESTVEPPACSPKSMYRLANMLGIPQLEEQALEAIRTSLTPPIILRECLSLFTSNYKAVILMEIQYLCDVYGDGRVKSRWPKAIAYMLGGNCAHAEEVVTILLRDRLVPNTNVSMRNIGRGYQQPLGRSY